MTDADARALRDEAARLFRQSPRTPDVQEHIERRRDEVRASHGKKVAEWFGQAAGLSIRPVPHPSGLRQPEPGNPLWDYMQEAAE